MSTSKPEPIRVSAQGIESRPVTMNEPGQGINWRDLSHLPPFQEFVSKGSPCPDGEEADKWALIQAQERIGASSEPELYEAYAQWHKATGRWPNETPMGELKNTLEA